MKQFSVYFPTRIGHAPIFGDGLPYPLPMDRYVCVAQLGAENVEDVFGRCQNLDQKWHPHQIRSMMVGDVVKDDETGTMYYCDMVGWVEYDETLVLINAPGPVTEPDPRIRPETEPRDPRENGWDVGGGGSISGDLQF